MLNKFLHFAFGAFFQTKDNNISFENRLENEDLTDDFQKRKEVILLENQVKTVSDLRRYAKKYRLEHDNLLITDAQAQLEAVNYYRTLRECSLIDDWCHPVEGIKEILNAQ